MERFLPTPSATEYGSNQSPSSGAAVRPSLQQMARTGMWPTPTARLDESQRQSSPELASQRYHEQHRRDLDDAVALTTGGPLNPTWVEWLMGFPEGWTDCEPSETPSSPKSPNTSGG
jgi:hypothetical protein